MVSWSIETLVDLRTVLACLFFIISVYLMFKLRKKKSLAYETVTDTSLKSIETHWEQLSKDCAFENFDISFQEKSEELNLARGMVGFHFRIPLAMAELNDHGRNRLLYEKSAFFVYQYEAGNLALRSLCDAICGSYNGASILLRSVLELDLKGAFYQCLTEEKYFSNAGVLKKDEKGKKLLEFLENLFDYSPDTQLNLGKTSIGIFDKLESVIVEREYQVSPSVIFKQLESWDLFEPIKNPKKNIYNTLYSKLSGDVHVMLDRTDLGKNLLKDPESSFKTPKVDPQFLQEYLDNLRDVIDAGTVLTFNMLKGNLKDKKIKDSLRQLIAEFSPIICELPYFQECLEYNRVTDSS